MLKKKRIMVIVFSGILLILFGLYIAWILYFTEARMYKEHWNINLPSNLEKQYDISSFGALGDGSSYTIYRLKDENAPFLEGASSRKNVTIQNDVIEILKKINVVKQKYPNFSNAYKWKILSMESDNRNKLYMLYDMGSSFVYFVQDFY